MVFQVAKCIQAEGCCCYSVQASGRRINSKYIVQYAELLPVQIPALEITQTICSYSTKLISTLIPSFRGGYGGWLAMHIEGARLTSEYR